MRPTEGQASPQEQIFLGHKTRFVFVFLILPLF